MIVKLSSRGSNVNPVPMLIKHPEMRRLTETILRTKKPDFSGGFYGVDYESGWCDDRYSPTVYIRHESGDIYVVEKSCRYHEED